MMITEFEKLTDIFPTSDLYKAIEAAYYEYDGDKAAFCKAYKANTDGLAERIQRAANGTAADEAIAADARIAKMQAEIESLKKRLEAEQEWKPYVDTDNYEQSRYDELKTAGGTRILTDEEAKDLLYHEFGFAHEMIIIHREIPRFEVNRHRQLRKVGEIERLPLYNATDWNYIRFDCGRMTYELINDDLRPFLH
mgnify:CR=1 FL=1